MTAGSADENKIILCECAARDGLQHEQRFLATDDKVRLINRFIEIGFSRVEVTSFSHPAYVPQFSDAAEVLRRIDRRPGVSIKAVCVNSVAVRRAVEARQSGAGPDEISIVVSASEAHSRKNSNRGHDEVRAQFEEMIPQAQGAGLTVCGTIGTAFGCPFTGEVTFQQVDTWVEFFKSQGITFVSLGDTTGMATPKAVRSRFAGLQDRHPEMTFAAHFHDTRGLALANCLAAVDTGVMYLDSSFGGLGGHPAKIKYAQGHTGNVATEDLVAALELSSFDTGIDMSSLISTAEFVEDVLGRPLSGRVTRAGLVSDLLDEKAPA